MRFSPEELETYGFAMMQFTHRAALRELRQIVREYFGPCPTQWPSQQVSSIDYLNQLRLFAGSVVSSGAVPRLLRSNLQPLVTLFGPDIDIQSKPHVRLARPDEESDQMDWHRDLFYGNSPWEINVWFPLFPLGDEAGLRYLPGSHQIAPANVRPTEEREPFRRAVSKGSIANQLGFVYLPKTEDIIANLNPADTALLRPRVGEAVVFFGSGIHRGQNRSRLTRISVDVRLKHPLAPTSAKPGYYRALSRGVINRVAQSFATA
jgi:hypothetical protein